MSNPIDPTSNINEALAPRWKEIADLTERLYALKTALTKHFSNLPLAILKKATWCYRTLDFDNLTRDEVETVLGCHLGKWSKTPNQDCMDYSTKTADGLHIRLWMAAPPDSCRVIEYQEVRPAQPETIVIRRKLLCTK